MDWTLRAIVLAATLPGLALQFIGNMVEIYRVKRTLRTVPISLAQANLSNMESAQQALAQWQSTQTPVYKFTRSDNGTLRFETEDWPDVIE